MEEQGKKKYQQDAGETGGGKNNCGIGMGGKGEGEGKREL